MTWFTRSEGTPFQGRHPGEERRDVFAAEQDRAASIYRPGTGELIEPVYSIAGAAEHRGSFGRDPETWYWGTGTNLQVARSSIPALMKVLADIMAHEPAEVDA